MPKKQKQYEDALGSIFDFIFEESQKPPKKVKPMKVTGVDGSSEMVDALSAVMENPLLFVNNSTLDAFNEALDIDLVKIGLGDRIPGAVSFNLQDLGSIVKDPKKFVDKSFAKMEGIRRSQRAAAAGDIMKSVLGGMWAKRNGLDWDSSKAMMVAGHQDAFIQDMMSKNRQLLEEHFVSGTKKMTLKDFQSRYGKVNGKKTYDEYVKWETGYKTGNKVDFYSNKNIYTVLQGHDLQIKANAAANPLDKDNLETARRFVDNMNEVRNLKEYTKSVNSSITKFRSEIERLKGIPGSQKYISEYRGKIRDLTASKNIANNYQLASKLGEYEGYFYSAKALFVDGELLPNIINGKFFEGKYNQIPWLQPSDKASISFKNRKGVIDSISCHVGKSTNNQLLNNLYEGMNSMYYLSPVSWVKTLATGEGFAYLAIQAEKRFMKKMEAVLVKKMASFKKEDFLREIMDGNLKGLFASISGLSPEEKRLIERFSKSYTRNGKLAHQFGSLSRIRGNVQAWFNKTFGVKVRNAVGKSLLKVTFINKFASESVKLWMKNGGLYTLANSVIQAGLQAIGFTVAGPVGQFVVTILSSVIIDIGMRLAKPIIKFGTEVVVIILIGIISSIILLFGTFYSMVFAKYSHVAPQEIVSCEAWQPSGLYSIDQEDQSTSDFSEDFMPGDLPPGTECLFAAGSALRCSQAPYTDCSTSGHRKPSHHNSPAIDVAVGGNFNAPQFCDLAKGNCVVTGVGTATCAGGNPAGGYVRFTAEYEGRTYEFYILHVAPGVQTGEKLGPGKAVATIVHNELWRMCSSGLHAHVTTKINGAYVNPRDVFNTDFKCNISECPKDVCM